MCKKQFCQTAHCGSTEHCARKVYGGGYIIGRGMCGLGVSNSYFSSVFKKEAGKSFISYLTDYRMDIAAEMILNTDEKSYTIAEKVGYLDANYFSYVFKKKFGVSPSKYRASVK